MKSAILASSPSVLSSSFPLHGGFADVVEAALARLQENKETYRRDREEHEKLRAGLKRRNSITDSESDSDGDSLSNSFSLLNRRRRVSIEFSLKSPRALRRASRRAPWKFSPELSPGNSVKQTEIPEPPKLEIFTDFDRPALFRQDSGNFSRTAKILKNPKPGEEDEIPVKEEIPAQATHVERLCRQCHQCRDSAAISVLRRSGGPPTHAYSRTRHAQPRQPAQVFHSSFSPPDIDSSADRSPSTSSVYSSLGRILACQAPSHISPIFRSLSREAPRVPSRLDGRCNYSNSGTAENSLRGTPVTRSPALSVQSSPGGSRSISRAPSPVRESRWAQDLSGWKKQKPE